MRLQLFVLDTPDLRRSAEFYAELLALQIEEGETDTDWLQLVGEAEGIPTLAFQLAPGLTPPDRPVGDPQRAHLDLEVDDLEEGERRAVAAGARRADVQPGARFRVFLDPIGHPFCLVLRRDVPTP